MGPDSKRGRQEIIIVFGGKPANFYNITFVVRPEVANPAAPGHDFQVIALLYSY